MRCFVPLVVLAVGLTPAAATSPELRLYRELPKDPLIAVAFSVDDLDGRVVHLLDLLSRVGSDEPGAALLGALEDLDSKLGVAVREDLLANLGPELALAVDLPPFDRALGWFPQAATGDYSSLLGGTGVVARAKDPKRLRRALETLIEHAGGERTRVGTSQRVRLILGDPARPRPVELYYAIRNRTLAFGFSRAWVEATLDGRAPGERLADGSDFAAVFAQLDPHPASLSYVNLPKLRRLVHESALVRGVLFGDSESGAWLRALFSEEMMGVGLGTTSIAAAGGLRTMHFGPDWISGAVVSAGLLGSLALPEALSDVEQSRRQRTIDDIRAIAVACEGFSGDANGFPGPTDGWIPVARIAAHLEPVYIASLPRDDAWHHPILYWSDGKSYRIVSVGSDGRMDRDWADAQAGVPSGSGDIVFADGRFTVVPGARD